MVIQSKKEPAEITITMVAMNGALGLITLIAIVKMAVMAATIVIIVALEGLALIVRNVPKLVVTRTIIILMLTVQVVYVILLQVGVEVVPLMRNVLQMVGMILVVGVVMELVRGANHKNIGIIILHNCEFFLNKFK
jgi:hypothetical protein